MTSRNANTLGSSFTFMKVSNIGDLVCTTPLLSALREKFSDAYLAALVNTNFHKSKASKFGGLGVILKISRMEGVFQTIPSQACFGKGDRLYTYY